MDFGWKRVTCLRAVFRPASRQLVDTFIRPEYVSRDTLMPACLTWALAGRLLHVVLGTWTE